MSRFGSKILVPVALVLLLGIGVVVGLPKFLSPQTSTLPEQTQSADVVKVLPGGSFNKFFPKGDEQYERVYTQEKKGFAEAKLKKEGQDQAMLSVSDTLANPKAADKYRNSDASLSGYPEVQIGSTATGVLVGDRLQVKVLSRDDGFDGGDRETWIQKFDLDGLAGLVPAS